MVVETRNSFWLNRGSRPEGFPFNSVVFASLSTAPGGRFVETDFRIGDNVLKSSKIGFTGGNLMQSFLSCQM